MSAFTPVLSYENAPTAGYATAAGRALASWPGDHAQPCDLSWHSWPSLHSPNAMEYANYWSSISARGSYGYLSFQPTSIPLNRSYEKPSQSYIGLIAEAILSVPEKKLVLSDIYNYILTNWPYFRTKGTGWRNSIRHNLSLNDCFVKTGRSPNGKGHFWTISPLYYEDFSNGDYGRRSSSRRVSKYLKMAKILPENCLHSEQFNSFAFANQMKMPRTYNTLSICSKPSAAEKTDRDPQDSKKPFDVQSILD